MSEQFGLTFGLVKADLATVTANGCGADDPRVLMRANEATKMLLDALIPVGGMATYDVVADGTQLLLPPELENAIEAHPVSALVRNQSDVAQGFYDCVNQFTYVDPSMAHDNPLVDMFLERDTDEHSVLRRRYDYPGLTSGATVRVTGAKRYMPLTVDGDSLIIQNVPALKLAILSLEYLERGASSVDDSEKYRKMAIERLTDEVKKHQLDPRRVAARKADYQSDITTYQEGSLGRTRGRLALELPGFMLKGKSEITYLINRAVQMLVDNRNQLAIAGRISVHGSTTELAYAPTNKAEGVLPWTDFNQIRLMIQGFITEGPDPNAVTVAEEYRKRAFDLQKAQLVEATEKARHTTYTTALSTYIPGTFGWTVARLALEVPGGLQMTTAEIERVASMAEMRIMERGVYKGCLKTLTAEIVGGDVLFPRDVEAVLAADICGNPIDIRSVFFPYMKNGPGFNYDGCQNRFDDQGEVFFQQSGSRRRKYFYRGSCSDTVQLKAVCKFRWLQKSGCDEMVIKNFEAIRLFSQGIMLEKQEKWTDAQQAQSDAVSVLEQELIQYLGGVQHVQNADPDSGFGFSGLGCAL